MVQSSLTRGALLALAVLAASVTPSLAQSTVVIPAGTANTEGSGTNGLPWGAGGAGMRVQHVYDSSYFTSQGVTTSPVMITRLRWRPDANNQPSWLNTSYQSAIVRLSTCPVDQSALSTASFAANQGSDLTTVYNGPLSFPAGTAAPPGPRPFLVDVPLMVPFVYDPYVGDLNIEVEIPTQSFVGTQIQLDVQDGTVLGSRVYQTVGYPTGAIVSEPHHVPVVEVTYATAPGYGSWQPFGSGCIRRSRSFYEYFATAGAFDLQNSAMTLVRNGATYMAVPGGSFVAPSASATVLALFDDSEVSVPLSGTFPFIGGTTSALQVCSNGFVSVAPGNGTSHTPSISGWLNSPQARWGCWHDYNPVASGSGHVKFEQIGQVAYVTWDAVYDYGGVYPWIFNTWQLQFDLTSGNVTYVWQTMSPWGGTGFLVGYAAPGPTNDLGSMNLSAAIPATFSTDMIDALPLTTALGSRPVIGTTFNIVTANVPPSTTTGLVVLSVTPLNPGLDLTPLGAPTCTQYVPLDLVLTFAPGGPTNTMPIAIPQGPGLAGLHVYGQSAVFAPGVDLLNAITSNGVQMTLDVH